MNLWNPNRKLPKKLGQWNFLILEPFPTFDSWHCNWPEADQNTLPDILIGNSPSLYLQISTHLSLSILKLQPFNNLIKAFDSEKKQLSGGK